MWRFTVKEQDGHKPCFIFDETNNLVITLSPPGDLAHAQSVKNFLNKHIKEIKPLRAGK